MPIPQKKIPNKSRAVCAGFYAVIINGRRFVIWHYSGQPLKGEIASC